MYRKTHSMVSFFANYTYLYFDIDEESSKSKAPWKEYGGLLVPTS